MYRYIVLTEDLVSTQPMQEKNLEPIRGFLTDQFFALKFNLFKIKPWEYFYFDKRLSCFRKKRF